MRSGLRAAGSAGRRGEGNRGGRRGSRQPLASSPCDVARRRAEGPGYARSSGIALPWIHALSISTRIAIQGPRISTEREPLVHGRVRPMSARVVGGAPVERRGSEQPTGYTRGARGDAGSDPDHEGKRRCGYDERRRQERLLERAGVCRPRGGRRLHRCLDAGEARETIGSVPGLWKAREDGNDALPALPHAAALGEPMSDRPAAGALDAAAQIVRHLSVAGLPTVLWTVIVCTALLKGDKDTIKYLWPYLYLIWLGLLAFWVLATGAAAAAGALRRGGTAAPSVDPQPEGAPRFDPSGQ